MKIILDITKSVEENAQMHFEKAKRAKKKLKGLNERRIDFQKIREKELTKANEKQQVKQIVKRTPQWYEKFHWCQLTNGMLAIGGRDATTNEILIKKHTQANDLVFHTDMAGSPFFVLQTNDQPIDDQITQDIATMTAVYSKAWQRGFSSIEVFSAKPEQVTKEAQSGEHLAKGAFMVRGNLTYYTPQLEIAITKFDQTAMCGPINQIQQQSEQYLVIVQGDRKVSDLAKEIAKALDIPDVDAIIRVLPTGGCAIDKRRSKF